MVTQGSLVSVLCAVVGLTVVRSPLAAATGTPVKRSGAPRPVARSSANCDITAATSISTQSASVAATFASEVSTFICNNMSPTFTETQIVAQGDAIAVAQADGFARAVANIAVECALSGNTDVSVNGQSVSSAQATLLAGAFINGVASASVCSSCSTQATLVAERISTAILDAVAVAEIALRDTSSGAPRTLVENQFAETVVNGTAIVVGELIVRAVSDLDGSCGVSLTASGFTDGNNLDAIPEDVFDCAINASAVPASFAQDAVANATIVTAASACELASSVNLTSAATEVATALAQVVLTLSQFCSIGDDFPSSSACSFASADITEFVVASATAIAQGFAEAISSCDPPLCAVSVSNVADEMASIIINSTVNSVSDLCTSPDGTFSTVIMAEEIAAASLEAIASVLVNARVAGPTCEVTITPEATVTAVPAGATPVLDTSFPSSPTIPPVTDGANITETPDSFSQSNAGDTVVFTPPLGDGIPAVFNVSSDTTAVTETMVTSCESGDCAGNFRQCAGVVNGVQVPTVPCCMAGFQCVQDSPTFGMCRRVGSKKVSSGSSAVIADSCGY